MLPTEKTGTNPDFFVSDREVVTRPGSLTITLNEQQYRDLRTLILRDTYQNHAGHGLGSLGDHRGPFGQSTADRMGDDRGNLEASDDDTIGPL